MEKYKKFTISIFPFNSDIVSGALWNLPIEGLTEESTSLIVYAKISSGLTIGAIDLELNSLVNQNLLDRFSILEKEEEQKNWNEDWEKQLNIIHIGKRIVIKPTFREYDRKSGEIVIELDPKMSFGTGEHSTTRLCLEIIEQEIQSNDTVFDLGSGTAVLSIAAAKLGARKVIAADHDEWCLINGKENSKLNDTDEIVEVRKATIEEVDENEFNLVIANINKNILTQSAENICAKIKKAGKLILSGFYIHDVHELSKLFANYNLTFVSHHSKDEWAAILMKKND